MMGFIPVDRRTGCVETTGMTRSNALPGQPALHSGRWGRGIEARAGSCRVAGSYAGDVGGEEVDPVAVEVAAGAIVVLGGAWIGVSGEIWASRSGTPAASALVMAACRNEWG